MKYEIPCLTNIKGDKQLSFISPTLLLICMCN